MVSFFIENLAPIMFVTLIIVLLFGYPVSFSLAFVGFVFWFIGMGLGIMNFELMQALPARIFDQMQNELLLAIPYFTFMGLILQKSGMAEDLLDTIGQLFGPVRGGLAYAVILVGTVLAATTGIVAASVIAMGLISLPIMLRYGYDRRVATGTIAASGTLAQIVPPSLVLIILADQLGQSVGNMYAGAMVPALMLVCAYIIYIFIVSIVSPQKVPALPKEARTIHGVQLLLRVITTLLPPLFLIFLVLGTVFAGIASPTEGGAMGAVGALILSFLKGRLTKNLIKDAVFATAKLSAFVMFILLGARVFSLTFYGVGGNHWVEHLLTSIPGGVIGFLIVANLIVFFLAFFLDYFELVFIIIPLLGPVASALGIDLVWFGVILAINMQTSFMHPPFGFSLFFLRSVAPVRAYRDKITKKIIQPITSNQIYLGALPFLGLQAAMVLCVMFMPSLVMHYKKDIQYEVPESIHLEMPADTSTNPYGANPYGEAPAPFGGEEAAPPSFGSPAPSFGVSPEEAPIEGAGGLPQPSFGQ